MESARARNESCAGSAVVAVCGCFGRRDLEVSHRRSGAAIDEMTTDEGEALRPIEIGGRGDVTSIVGRIASFTWRVVTAGPNVPRSPLENGISTIGIVAFVVLYILITSHILKRVGFWD
jgi:hypothetical protein